MFRGNRRSQFCKTRRAACGVQAQGGWLRALRSPGYEPQTPWRRGLRPGPGSPSEQQQPQPVNRACKTPPQKGWGSRVSTPRAPFCSLPSPQSSSEGPLVPARPWSASPSFRPALQFPAAPRAPRARGARPQSPLCAPAVRRWAGPLRLPLATFY